MTEPSPNDAPTTDDPSTGAAEPTPAAPAPEPAAKEPAAPWKRYAVILGLVLVGLAVTWFVVGERFKANRHISGLHSNEGRTRSAHVKAIKEHPNKDLMIELLSDAVDDKSNAFEVRRICADLLHRHFGRLSILERKLRTSNDVETRGVILRSLMGEAYFKDQIVSDPDFRVADTVKAWLARENDLTRMHAIQIAVRADLMHALPQIRSLIGRSGAPMIHKTQERNLMIAAAGATEAFKDCDSMPRLLEVAKADGDKLVRLRFMQIIDRAVFRTSPPTCPEGVDEEQFAAFVRDRLEDEAHEVRMGAMLILARNPAWAKPATARLREILDGPKEKDGRDTGAERRHALEVLVGVGEAEDIARIPAACHDMSVEVRSTAARSIKTLSDAGYEGCWIGILEDETESELLWIDTLDLFYKWAKVRVRRLGFPPVMSRKAVNDPGAWRQDLIGIFGGEEKVVTEDDGTFMRISRASITEDHFRWYARKLGLEEDAVTKALAARKAFYDAKRRGDAKAAQGALEGAPRAENMWAYEEAWLAKNL